MNNSAVIEKFGANYKVTQDTFHMGTHQLFAKLIAKRFQGLNTVLDACVGAGFNTIPLARVVKNVIAVDINPEHLRLAEANAKIAGLTNITFMLGDITDSAVLNEIQDIDAAYLDPDWAKIGDNKEVHVTKIEQMVPNGITLLDLIYKKTHNIAFRLPKEIDKEKLLFPESFELEPAVQSEKIKFYTCYLGDLKK